MSGHLSAAATAAGDRHIGAARPKLLSEIQLAEHLNVSVRTIQGWRLHGGGPAFTRCGRLVRYHEAAVDLWLQSNTVKSTSEAK